MWEVPRSASSHLRIFCFAAALVLTVGVMGTIKVLATPEAYEWVMNSDSPAVQLVLDAASSYVRSGFTDEKQGEAICFMKANRFCLRLWRAESPDADSFVIITHNPLIKMCELFKMAFPITLP